MKVPPKRGQGATHSRDDPSCPSLSARSRGFAMLVFTFWKIPSSDAILNPLTFSRTIPLTALWFALVSLYIDAPLTHIYIHVHTSAPFAFQPILLFAYPPPATVRMNMDVDVDAQRAASHTEISARSSSEFQVVNVRRIIRTQVRRSRV